MRIPSDTVLTVLGFVICICHQSRHSGVVVVFATDEHQANNVNNRLRARIRRDVPVVTTERDGGEAFQQIVGGEEVNVGEYPYFGTF